MAMRLRVLWFGHPGRSPFENEVETYRQRTCRRWPAEDLPMKPVTRQRSDNPAAALSKEAATVLDRHPRGWCLGILDERARPRTSRQLASALAELEQSRPGLTLVIGSDLGLDPSLRRDAQLHVSLGPLTLPHQLARLVLWEQLYRATDILGSGRYHRAGIGS